MLVIKISKARHQKVDIVLGNNRAPHKGVKDLVARVVVVVVRQGEGKNRPREGDLLLVMLLVMAVEMAAVEMSNRMVLIL